MKNSVPRYSVDSADSADSAAISIITVSEIRSTQPHPQQDRMQNSP